MHSRQQAPPFASQPGGTGACRQATAGRSEIDMRHVRVGLFGIGLDAYWPQFAGLKERLEGYIDIVAGRLERPGVEVVNLGLIDTPEKALVAGHQFRREDVDVIFLYITTYALSATVLPVVQRARVPVVAQRPHRSKQVGSIGCQARRRRPQPRPPARTACSGMRRSRVVSLRPEGLRR